MSLPVKVKRITLIIAVVHIEYAELVSESLIVWLFIVFELLGVLEELAKLVRQFFA